jgi:hypothetical protein
MVPAPIMAMLRGIPLVGWIITGLLKFSLLM